MKKLTDWLAAIIDSVEKIAVRPRNGATQDGWLKCFGGRIWKRKKR